MTQGAICGLTCKLALAQWVGKAYHLPMPDAMTPIRLRVQELREALGWSQRTLAEKAGVRAATVVDVEKGKGVNLATLEKLANALDVNAAALIDHKRPASAKRGKGR